MRHGKGRHAPARRPPDPVWRKAPFVFFRFPGLAASLAFGGLLLALAAAEYPLFISSSASSVIASQVADATVTRYGAGVTYQSTSVPFEYRRKGGRKPLYVERGEAFAAEVRKSPYLGPTLPAILGPLVNISVAGRPESDRQGRLFAGAEAMEHISVVSGHEGPGVWLPDLVSKAIGARAGDRVVLRTSATGPVVTERVDGIYRSLYAEPETGYWRSWAQFIYTPCADCGPPPQFVVAELGQLKTISLKLREDQVTFQWQAPLADGMHLTLPQARREAAFTTRLGRDVSHGRLSKIFGCCGRLFSFEGLGVTVTSFTSSIPQVLGQAERRLATVQPPVFLLLVAGLTVAGAVVGAAGAFAHATRRTEGALLFARGRAPIAVGLKAGLESFLPVAAGAAAGLGSAWLLVTALGPGGPLDPAAVKTAIVAAAVVVPAAALLVGVVASLMFLRQSEHHTARLAALGRFPFELVLLGLGAYFLVRLQRTGAYVSATGLQVSRPSATLFLFPLLALAGIGTAVARGLRWALRVVRDRSGRLWPSVYLSAHRLAGSPRLLVLLFAGATVSLGTFAHSETLVRSLDRTVDAKATVFVGSDAQGIVDRRTVVPDDPVPMTKVTRINEAGVFRGTTALYDLLAVDRATFARTAFWDETFSDVSLEELIGRLGRPAGEAFPAIAVGTVPSDRPSIELGNDVIALEVVGRARAFPGELSRRPLFVVEAAALSDRFPNSDPLVDPRATTEVWAKGTPDAARAALRRLPSPPVEIVTADEVKDVPAIAAVTQTFGILKLLAVGAGALVILVVLMYLQARQRAQVVSYALSSRMGLAERSYRRSLVIELAVVLGLAFAVGTAAGLATARFVVPKLDPLATIPPDPLFLLPLGIIAGAAVVIALACWLGSRAVHAQVRHTNVAEVLRLGE